MNNHFNNKFNVTILATTLFALTCQASEQDSNENVSKQVEPEKTTTLINNYDNYYLGNKRYENALYTHKSKEIQNVARNTTPEAVDKKDLSESSVKMVVEAPVDAEKNKPKYEIYQSYQPALNLAKVDTKKRQDHASLSSELEDIHTPVTQAKEITLSEAPADIPEEKLIQSEAPPVKEEIEEYSYTYTDGKIIPQIKKAMEIHLPGYTLHITEGVDQQRVFSGEHTVIGDTPFSIIDDIFHAYGWVGEVPKNDVIVLSGGEK